MLDKAKVLARHETYRKFCAKRCIEHQERAALFHANYRHLRALEFSNSAIANGNMAAYETDCAIKLLADLLGTKREG